jgi:hypothetical protein
MKLLPDTTTFHSDRSWAFDLSADELWPHLVRLEDYRDWWPWCVPVPRGPDAAWPGRTTTN